MAKTVKTDLELLHEIKDNDSVEAREVLWNKYQNKINSNYFHHLRFYTCAEISLEEFRQESYLFFDKAINFIDFDVMEKTGSKSFATTFYWYLLKAMHSFDKEFEKKTKQLYTSDIFFTRNENDGLNSPMSREYNRAVSVSFEEQVNKATTDKIIENYLESLNGDGKVIMELFLESKKITDISKSVNMKYQDVYSFIKKTKKELKVIYQREAII